MSSGASNPPNPERVPGRAVAIIRGVVAVFLGYAGFAAGLSLLVLRFFHDRPAGEAAGPVVILLSTGAQILLGLVVGAIVTYVAGRHTRWPARIVLALILLATIGNIVLGRALEPLWFKLGVLGLLSPAFWFAHRRLRRAAA